MWLQSLPSHSGGTIRVKMIITASWIFLNNSSSAKGPSGSDDATRVFNTVRGYAREHALEMRRVDSSFNHIAWQLCDLGMLLTSSELCFLICRKKVLAYALVVVIIRSLKSLLPP